MSDNVTLQIIKARNGFVVEIDEEIDEEENCYVFSDMKSLLEFIRKFFNEGKDE